MGDVVANNMTMTFPVSRLTDFQKSLNQKGVGVVRGGGRAFNPNLVSHQSPAYSRRQSETLNRYQKQNRGK